MIQLVGADDVKTRKNIKNKEEATNAIPLIGPDEIIEDKSKSPDAYKKAKVIIKDNVSKNKKYHLLRWKIKRILIQEKNS